MNGPVPARSFWTNFGPGLLWAAAAIGVSHLVQSTRAGATAGFGLIGVIVLALILKYPFFEFGPRYAAATGQSLVEGYRRIGKWALWLYFILTLFTSLIVDVAIVLFTGFLLQFALGLTMPQWVSGGLVYVGETVGVYRNVDGVEYFQNIDDLQVVAGRDCPAVPAVDKY